MKLFTKEIDNKLFSQYSKGSDLNSQMVVIKIFNPYGKGVWYLVNSDPDDPEYIWAIVDLHDIEVGSVNRSDLENLKVPPFRLGLERDLYFTPMNAETLYKNLLGGKKYAEGGETEGDENKQMLENQAYNISHHSKELNNAIKHTKSVEPWVITKTQRATTDLADVTHYLEGENAPKMANGGSTSDSDDGGYSIMRHKYYPWITIKLLESTNKGWKVEQSETKSPSGKDLRTPKTKIAYYRDSEIKGDRAIFEKFEKGGLIDEQNLKTKLIGHFYQIIPEGMKTSGDEYADKIVDVNIDSDKYRYRNVRIQGERGNAEELIPLTEINDFLSGKELLKKDNKGYYAIKLLRNKKKAMMAKGGATFAEKVSAIKSRLKGTKVPSKLQKDYGKRYSSKEAEIAAKRIAGAMRKKEL
jgi:hypothetical protein